MTGRAKVFLSYALNDIEPARKFSESLQAAGLNVWWNMSESDKTLEDRLGQELRDARVFVVLLTEESIRSPWTFFTLGTAIESGKYIIPVLLGNIRPYDVPPILRKYTAVSGVEPDEAGRRVATAIEQFEAENLQEHYADS